ncbi:MAG TPA: sigma-70 family RNA polymerase sigma factor [Dehalococcoidia bacterium]|nr:sigma-70 family RNA polymerase sigma factor [Dehalococcoidia bacterium]
MTNERELIQRARRGDEHAFTQLHDLYRLLVFNVCLRMLGDRAAAEDAAQDAFISAWLNIRQLRGDNFRAWLMTITRNACGSQVRRAIRRPADSLDKALEKGFDLADAADPARDVAGAETMREIEQTLRQLPEEQRFAIILCDIQHMSYEDIARSLDCSIGTVKSRINRGRKLLQAILAQTRELSRQP